jgi:hypothetical protein
MRDKTEDVEREVDERRRAVIAAMGAAPVIMTLLPGRARAEYRGGEYFEGSCAAPPDQANSDACGTDDTGGGNPGGP